MQAFAYHHLVPAQEFVVTVSGRWMPRAPVKILSATPVKIPAGGTARVQVGTPTNIGFGRMHLELNDPPEGITIQNVAPVGWGTEIVLKSDATKVKPGLKGNLIVNLFIGWRGATAQEKPSPQARRLSWGTLPAIPFEIVSP